MRQMRSSGTNAAAASVSVVTIGIQGILDEQISHIVEPGGLRNVQAGQETSIPLSLSSFFFSSTLSDMTDGADGGSAGRILSSSVPPS